MQVRRHGVPHRSGLKDRQAQQQLARVAGGGDDVLVDGPLVRGLQRAAFQRPGGKALEDWIETCPDADFAALTYLGGAAWRERSRGGVKARRRTVTVMRSV